MTGSGLKVLPALLVLLVWSLPAASKELPGDELLTDSACTGCHAEAAAAWRSGPHGAAVESGCRTCHGQRHASVGARARRSGSCIDCHGGKQGAVARSYITSKHGVIAGLEAPRWDWSQGLREGNYRAPTCAYCHMHDGTHGRLLSTEVLQTACADCHSSRYIETMFDAGRRMLGIAHMKLAEAVTAAGPKPPPEIGRLLETMRARSMRNLRLGVGHQSPDYQWWHGHAALDGDLVAIKAALSRKARRRGSRKTP